MDFSLSNLIADPTVVVVVDPSGNDFYYGAGASNFPFIVDYEGSDFFDFSRIDQSVMLWLQSSELFGHGNQAINVGNDLQIGTGNSINLHGYSRYSDVISHSASSFQNHGNLNSNFESIVNFCSGETSPETLYPNIAWIPLNDFAENSTSLKPSAFFWMMLFPISMNMLFCPPMF